jgi:mRNA-degrading endonuclease YafQ of YafQ-DinJ toxin-antitoxin module
MLRKNPNLAKDVHDTLKQLEKDAYHPSLRTHRLTGVLCGAWACRAGYDLRIIFSFVNHDGKKAILLESIGTHDEVY